MAVGWWSPLARPEATKHCGSSKKDRRENSRPLTKGEWPSFHSPVRAHKSTGARAATNGPCRDPSPHVAGRSYHQDR